MQARSSKWQEKEANKKRKPVAKGSNRRRKNKNICERKQAARQQARHGRKKQPELFVDPHPNKSPNSVATLGVLTVRVKARWLIDMVSYVCACLGDPYSTKVPL